MKALNIRWGDSMVKCPKCGSEDVTLMKKWPLAPKNRKPVIIGLYKCNSCGYYFRKGVKE
ncbi:MAG: chorismate-binding protein [Thermoprotei archaeon]|nr:MAG: chorismate-binding protein [Thermoprotei archaeon]